MNTIKISNITTINSANYNNIAGSPTTVGSNGGSSAYGTYDQNGNVSERCSGWAEINFVLGGSYSTLSLRTSTQDVSLLSYTAKFSALDIGVRIFSINNPFSLSNFLNISDINNTANPSNIGSVSYIYMANKFPLTNNEYTDFLNSIAATDTNSVYNNTTDIIRNGSSGSYSYVVNTNMGNKPARNLNWFQCARYCNWLHNNKPIGSQNTNTTEDGSYSVSGLSPAYPLVWNTEYGPSQASRNIGAKYFIPNVHEWYKAAYYKGNGTNAGYWDYATQSNTMPTAVLKNTNGNGLIPSILLSPKTKNLKLNKV